MPAVTALLDTLSIDSLRRWGLKGGISFLDQGTFSGANFVLNVLLARWLDPAAFGAFVVAFAVFLFFTGFHNALILEPMSVLGPSKHAGNLPQYISFQFRLHIWLSCGLGLSMLAVGGILRKFGGSETNGALGSAIMAAAVALPFMLFIWLVRRIYYLLGKPTGALACSVLYAICLGAGILLSRATPGQHGVATWYAVLGVAGLLGGLVPPLLTGVPFTRRDLSTRDRDQILSEQWVFGRWLVAATILYAMGVQIQILLAAVLLGLGSAGIWRAVQNFALPMIQSITAVAVLGLPTLSREFGARNFAALRRKGLWITLLLTAAAVAYEAALLIFSGPLERLLYGNKFSSYVWLIPVVGLVPILTAIETGFSLIVRSLQRPVFYLVYNASMAGAGIIFAPILILAWGLAGAALSQIVVALVSLAVIVYIYRRWFPGESGESGPTVVRAGGFE
jgi:O-antigen/teichoic acid export membrane protein